MKKVLFLAMALCCTAAMFAAKTLYFTPNSNWKQANAKFAMYYFKSADNNNNGWSAFMEEQPGGAYKGEIPDGYDMVIFVRIKNDATEPNWDNKWNQTTDLTVPATDSDYFTLYPTEWDNLGGTWSKYVAPEKKDIIYKVKVPEGTTECYIAGDWNGDGNWVFKQMTAVDAVDHQFEYEAKEQYASFVYKYCSAASWDNEELTIDGKAVANRTYDDKNPIDVVVKFKTLAWYIIGSFNEWSAGYALVKDENASYNTTIELEAKKNYEFKILLVVGNDSTWYGLPNEGNVMKYGSCSDWTAYKSEGNFNQANVGLLSTKAGDYTFSVDVANKVDDKIAPKFSVNIPEPDPDMREKREIVLLPGELKSNNPTMIVFAFTEGKEAFDATMQVKKEGEDTVAYIAEIPKELDSLIFVRAKDGLNGWNDLIWDGENKNVWNQSEDQNISAECDTAAFHSWDGKDGKFVVYWCGEEPVQPAATWYIKLPDEGGAWAWHEMVEEADATWTYNANWIGGGANTNTKAEDENAKYIKDEEMNFGDNMVAPEVGTPCTFIWTPATEQLAVHYVMVQAIGNVSIELNLNAPMFNVLGVEVDETFHGIVIQNGHKFIR